MRHLLTTLALLLLVALPVRADGPLNVGSPLPDFNETSISGQSLPSSGLRRPVAIWLTNFSDGSNAATPDLLAMCQKHSALNLLVISLNGPVDGKAKAFAQRFDLGGQVAVDPDGSTVRLFTGAFVEGGIPLYNLFLFDGQGRMTGRYHYPGIPPSVLESEMLRL